MIDMKEINKRINECERTNINLKEDPTFDVSHAVQFYNLRNLMDEVKTEMQMQLIVAMWNYDRPNEIDGLTAKEIRENTRRMFKEAEKYGLEDMSISNNHCFYINDQEFAINFSSRFNTMTIDKFVENTNPNITNRQFDFEQIYSKQFDSTLDMVNAYFDIIDSDYQLVKDLVNNYIHCETREEVFDAYVETLEKAGWETHYITGVNFEYLELTCNTSTGDKFVCDIDCHDTSFDEKVSDIRDYLMDFDGKDDVRKMLEKAVNITENAAKVYNELPENSHNKGIFHNER